MPPIRIASGATPAITVSGAAAAITRNAMPPVPSAFARRCSADRPPEDGCEDWPPEDGCDDWPPEDVDGIWTPGRADRAARPRSAAGGVAVRLTSVLLLGKRAEWGPDFGGGRAGDVGARLDETESVSVIRMRQRAGAVKTRIRPLEGAGRVPSAAHRAHPRRSPRPRVDRDS